MAIRYEYLTRRMDTTSPTTIEEDLNNIGRHGWELVQALPDRTYIFRRPLPMEFGPSETKIVEPAERKQTGPLSEAILKAHERSRK